MKKANQEYFDSTNESDTSYSSATELHCLKKKTLSEHIGEPRRYNG